MKYLLAISLSAILLSGCSKLSQTSDVDNSTTAPVTQSEQRGTTMTGQDGTTLTIQATPAGTPDSAVQASPLATGNDATSIQTDLKNTVVAPESF